MTWSQSYHTMSNPSIDCLEVEIQLERALDLLELLLETHFELPVWKVEEVFSDEKGMPIELRETIRTYGMAYSAVNAIRDAVYSAFEALVELTPYNFVRGWEKAVSEGVQHESET